MVEIAMVSYNIDGLDPSATQLTFSLIIEGWPVAALEYSRLQYYYYYKTVTLLL
jgi:hypothetical protein